VHTDLLREQAARSRRLALECTDQQTRVDLLTFARELDDRAKRMEIAIQQNQFAKPKQ